MLSQLPPTTEIQIQQQHIAIIRPLTEEEKLLYNNAEIDVDKTINRIREELQQKKQKDTQDLLQHLDNSLLTIPLQEIQSQIKDIKTKIRTLKSNYQTNNDAIGMQADTVLELQEQKNNLQKELERGLLANEKSINEVKGLVVRASERIDIHYSLANDKHQLISTYLSQQEQQLLKHIENQTATDTSISKRIDSHDVLLEELKTLLTLTKTSASQQEQQLLKHIENQTATDTSISKRIDSHDALLEELKTLLTLTKTSASQQEQQLLEQQSSINRLQNWLIVLTGGSVLALTIWLWHYTHK